MVSALRRFATGVLPMLGLFALLLISLYVMSDAAQNSERFGRLYVWLLLINTIVLMVLTVMIGVNLFDTVRRVMQREAGSRLTLRLVVMFIVLSLAPVSIVYYFSVKFIERGIDSWFDVRVEGALNDALDLSRTSLDYRLRRHLKQVEALAQELRYVTPPMAPATLSEQRQRVEASELTLFGEVTRIIAVSSDDTTLVVPQFPAEEIVLMLKQGQNYVGLEPLAEGGLRVRVVVPVPRADPISEQRMLQALFGVDPRIGRLADSVSGAFEAYKELAYVRKPLIQSYTITLSLVLLLSVLFAVWTAFYSSRRLMAPIRELAEGTKAVAAGEFSKKLPVGNRDELGFLVRSFNQMTARLASARDEADRSRGQLERQRTYLEAVLRHLSSGVLTLDRNLVLRMNNAAADQIFGFELEHHIGRPLADIARHFKGMERFYESILPMLLGDASEWEEQVLLFGGAGSRTLICRGVRLSDQNAMRGGHVIVFDDVTELIRAQRDAAWGEVARRLAHEIKNPLTPIQLSAERLQRKLMPQLGEKDADMLARSTRTIVQQVEAMKAMVNAFSDYARAPAMQLATLDFNSLISEVADLYRSNRRRVRLRLDLDTSMPYIEADVGRLRQLLNNLVQNALDAMEGQGGGELLLSTRCMEETGCRFVEFATTDTGPGVPQEMLHNLFEPYVTGKIKGTGLGLAIVKKIVEEHGGIVWAENRLQGGARIVIRLPVVRVADELVSEIAAAPDEEKES